MASFIYPQQQVSIPGAATEATQLLVLAEVTDINTNTADVSTATKQDAQTAILTDIETNTTGLATEATLSTLNAKVTAVNTGAVVVSSSALPTGAATEATAASSLTELQGIGTSSSAIENNTSILATIETLLRLEPVDQLDVLLLNTSGTNIPASSGNPLQVVATLAGNGVYKLLSVEDIGEYIGVYTGPALSEQLLCVLPLGGGEVNVNIPASTRISLRAMENTAISTGKIAINFLGLP